MEQEWVYLSSLLDKPVVDESGARIGRLVEVVGRQENAYPQVTRFVVQPRRAGRRLSVAWELVREWKGGCATVSFPPSGEFPDFSPEPTELLFRHHLLDRQIVDTLGAKVVRVNDLQMQVRLGRLWLVHVDVGFRGLLRRLGFEDRVMRAVKWLFSYEMKDKMISWRVIQVLPVNVGPGEEEQRIIVPTADLSNLHPADLADIIEELGTREREAVFRALDTETAADVLEETEPQVQRTLIDAVSDEQAADILEAMSPSDATDLLQDLSEPEAEELLTSMEEEAAQDIRELLSHHERTAGGLMTTAFLALGPDTTAAEALSSLKREAAELDVFGYVYVVDAEERIFGVVSLKELFEAAAETRLGDMMTPRVISVETGADQMEVAKAFAKYGFRAIPVVDEEQKLCGAVHFDRIMEVVAPELGG